MTHPAKLCKIFGRDKRRSAWQASTESWKTPKGVDGSFRSNTIRWHSRQTTFEGAAGFASLRSVFHPINMGRIKQFSRVEVLEKAIPLFWEKGFSETTVQDLEAVTGVNKSGLYSEFQNKEDLFMASLKHYLQTRGGADILSVQPLGWTNCGPCNNEEPHTGVVGWRSRSFRMPISRDSGMAARVCS
jgi:hypothetical protein